MPIVENPRPDPESVGETNVRVVWEDDGLSSPTVVNLFAFQATPEGLILSAGFGRAPLFSGTEEEQKAQAAAVTEIHVRPVVRLLINYNRFGDLAGAIQGVIGMLTENSIVTVKAED